jgi:hypothetical protein
MEVEVALVRVLLSAGFPSRDGAPWSFFVRRPTSPSPLIFGAFVVPRPDPMWPRIRKLKMKVNTMLTSSATTTAFLRVGSADPAISDFPAATGLAAARHRRLEFVLVRIYKKGLFVIFWYFWIFL